VLALELAFASDAFEPDSGIVADIDVWAAWRNTADAVAGGREGEYEGYEVIVHLYPSWAAIWVVKHRFQDGKGDSDEVRYEATLLDM